MIKVTPTVFSFNIPVTIQDVISPAKAYLLHARNGLLESTDLQSFLSEIGGPQGSSGVRTSSVDYLTMKCQVNFT